MIENPHIADRPSWDCRSCGQPWPCIPAKAYLMIEYRGLPTNLAIYLTLLLEEASKDLGEPVADLWGRFHAWRGEIRQRH